MISVKFETSQTQIFECFESRSLRKGETRVSACAERKAAAWAQQPSLPPTGLAGGHEPHEGQTLGAVTQGEARAGTWGRESGQSSKIK